jgi:hypothetical protein
MDANNTNDLLSALIFIVGACHFDNYNLHYYKAVWTKGGIGRAFVTALTGTVIYFCGILHFWQRTPISVVGGIIWLIALKVVYNIGWFKAFVIAAVV